MYPQSEIGAYFPDNESYHLFEEFAYPLIKAYHGAGPADTEQPAPNWDHERMAAEFARLGQLDPHGHHLVGRIRICVAHAYKHII